MVTSPDTPASLLCGGEKLVSLAAVAARLGTRSSTVFRWVQKGRPVNGVPVRLPAVRVGHSWRTTFEAVARWSEQLTQAALPADDDSPAPTPTPTPKQRDRAARAASAKLDALLGTTTN